MLQPTTGMVERSQLFHSCCAYLCYCSSLVSLFHLFFGFFFVGLCIVWDFLKAIIGIFAFCTQLVILQGQYWEMLDLPEVHADSQM